MKSNLIVKSTKHYLNDNNTGKLKHLKVFLEDYRIVVQRAIDFYWDKHNLHYGNQSKTAYTDKKHFDYCTSIDISDLNISGRTRRSAVDKAQAMIVSVLGKYKKKCYALQKVQEKGDTNKEAKINSWLYKNRVIRKPKVPKKINAEIDSNLVSMCVSTDTKEFDLLFKFASLFNDYYKRQYLPKNKLFILTKKHKRFNYWNQRKDSIKKSFLLNEKYICVRFNILPPKKKETGRTVAIDQGINTLLTLVDTNKNVYQSSRNKQGIDFKDILIKLANKKKGSKSFQKTVEHRQNFINWAINQLDTTDIKEIRLEEIKNIFHKQKRSRFLNGFTNALIRDKLQDMALLTGVQLVEQSSAYRSQRCNSCGFVHYLNRSNKDKEIFECRCCGHTANADVNAASNHLVEGLPVLKHYLVKGINRTSGFYWNPVDDEVQGVYSPLVRVLVRKTEQRKKH